MKLIHEKGNKWARIAKMMGNKKSQHTVKNRGKQLLKENTVKKINADREGIFEEDNNNCQPIGSLPTFGNSDVFNFSPIELSEDDFFKSSISEDRDMK